MIQLDTPITPDTIESLKVGDQVEIHGRILCGRDAVLPKIVQMIRNRDPLVDRLQLDGAVIFHTAVSPAGIGPTTSNKVEIEESIPELSAAGVRIHIGKGSVGDTTIAALQKNGSVFAVTPPVSALFGRRSRERKIVAFEEEGMEALFEMNFAGLPAIIAAAHGRNIFKG